MRIGVPEIVDHGEAVRIQAEVEDSTGMRPVWFEVPREYAPFLMAERLDAFVVGMLPLAMKQGETLRLDAPISEKLFHNLKTCMHLFSAALPYARRVEILARSLDSGDSNGHGRGVATGFSGGVDSFCALADHYVNEQCPSFKITHLLFNNVGAHDLPDSTETRRLFDARYAIALACAKGLGLPLIRIDSNLSEVLGMDFRHRHVLSNATVPLLFQKLFSKFYYASAYAFPDCYVGPMETIGHLDPFVVPLLSTEAIDCISTGCRHSRVDKTRIVSEIEASYRHLSVCIWPGPGGENCSMCNKCCRTMLTLELFGKLERYKAVFDIERFRKVRTRYIAKLLCDGRDAYSRELRDLLRQTGTPIPLPSRLLAPLYASQTIRKMLAPLGAFLTRGLLQSRRTAPPRAA